MQRFLFILCSLLLLMSCASEPDPTPTPATPVAEILLQDLQQDLETVARPRPFASGSTPSQQEIEAWESYRQSLANALGKLFADGRSQSLPPGDLVGIFANGSGLPVTIFEGFNDFVVAIHDVYPAGRIGGGGSPEGRTVDLYLVNRQGEMVPLGLVGKMVDAVWAADRWTILVGQTIWGNQIDYEVWQLWPQGQALEAPFMFEQLHSVPEPQLSDDGRQVTQFFPARFDCGRSVPLSCCSSSGAEDPACEGVASRIYTWEEGAYK